MKSLILSICLLFVCTSSAFAETNNPLEQLSAGDFATVEQAFSSLQTQFEQGEASEYELLDAYKVFYQQEDKYSAQFADWIKHYPKSSSAYLARGVYYRKLGEFRRGTKYVGHVPDEALQYMQKMHQLAKNDLNTSLQLNPKSYLSVLHLLNIAQFEADNLAASKYLALANKIYPENFMVRARYLIHLTPKLGGSYELMEKFIDECRVQGVPKEQIDLFNAIKFDDLGNVAEEQGQLNQAIPVYVYALSLGQSAGMRFRQDYLPHAPHICTQPPHDSMAYCQEH